MEIWKIIDDYAGYTPPRKALINTVLEDNGKFSVCLYFNVTDVCVAFYTQAPMYARCTDVGLILQCTAVITIQCDMLMHLL